MHNSVSQFPSQEKPAAMKPSPDAGGETVPVLMQGLTCAFAEGTL